jgi:hypothetical protein
MTFRWNSNTPATVLQEQAVRLAANFCWRYSSFHYQEDAWNWCF